MVKSSYGLQIICNKQTTVVSIFSNLLRYQHPLIKTHLFNLENIATYIGWVVSKLTSQQNNTRWNKWLSLAAKK